jgi:site-specific DNA-methyltransferase (adenine-specific)
LKPAWEPIVVARKPLIRTVAENVLAHGTGALNIDACRVPFADGETTSSADSAGAGLGHGAHKGHGRYNGVGGVVMPPHPKGRFPANVIHDGSDEVLEAFAQFGERGGGFEKRGAGGQNGVYSPIGGTMQEVGFGDTGTAARFFYCAKANKADRAGTKHPTVKPIALMRYLCRLVTPPGGVVLDPFAGSGTTLQAAVEEGFRAIGIEREAEYVADIRRRLESVKAPEPAPASDQLALFAAE